MTPFMMSVQSLIDGDVAPVLRTEPSQATPVAVATDTQVMVRSLAEQLVSEANAILRERGRAVELVDDSGPGELAFTVTYRDRSARVVTAVHGRTAEARLVLPGVAEDEHRRLATEDEVQALVLSLLAGQP